MRRSSELPVGAFTGSARSRERIKHKSTNIRELRGFKLQAIASASLP